MRLRKLALILLAIIVMQYLFLSCTSKTKDSKSLIDTVAQVSKSDTVSSISSKDTVRFDFENGTQEWKSKNWRDFRGSSGVEARPEYPRYGNYSLMLDCSVNPGGEAYVDLRDVYNSSLDLNGKKITCWVLIVPQTETEHGVISDNMDKKMPPNGVQLFVRSVKNEGKPNEKWYTQYGKWYDLSDKIGRWFEINLAPSIKTSDEVHSEKGFDPKNVAVIGIKISDKTRSSCSFKGTVFLDDISW